MDKNNLKIPAHIALIMDGNRRWAKGKGLPKIEGHRNGALALEKVIDRAGYWGVKSITAYAFSSENRHRDPQEIKDLMYLLKYFIKSKRKKLHKLGAKLKILGDLSYFPQDLQEEINKTVDYLKNCSRINLNIALNYGGRAEIARACRNLIKENKKPEEISEEIIARYLYTRGDSDPDLVIRTGGELRLSNFLTWQSTYSELYFTEVLWPDFDGSELDKAIEEYSRRQRRFGK